MASFFFHSFSSFFPTKGSFDLWTRRKWRWGSGTRLAAFQGARTKDCYIFGQRIKLYLTLHFEWVYQFKGEFLSNFQFSNAWRFIHSFVIWQEEDFISLGLLSHLEIVTHRIESKERRKSFFMHPNEMKS